MRDARLIRAVVLLAMVVGLAYVGHDLLDRPPFWQSREETIRRGLRRIHESVQPRLEMAELPAEDEASVAVLVACLESQDERVRSAACQAAHLRLDQWRLRSPQEAGTKMDAFMTALQERLAASPESAAMRLAARELAARGLQLSVELGDSGDFAKDCQRILESCAEKAPVPQLESAGDFEESFSLFDGGMDAAE